MSESIYYSHCPQCGERLFVVGPLKDAEQKAEYIPIRGKGSVKGRKKLERMGF